MTILLGSLGSGPSVAALTAAQVFASVSASVWRVQTYDKDGLALSQGSAVVIAPETLVTNCHVLRKAGRFVVVREGQSLGGTLELWDPERDLCQIKARGLVAPAVVLGAADRLVAGQPVFALGSPSGLELTLSSGLISSLRRRDSGRLERIQISAPISPGSSGGGLFDEDGKLIGVTSSGVVSGNAQNLNFAVPVDDIRELPQRHAMREASRANSPVQAGTVEARTDGLRPDLALPAPTAVIAADRLPVLLDRRDRNYQLYLSNPMPKAFAIADNGHSARASGTSPRETNRPTDPKERALQICAENAGKPCTLFSVDNVIVYRP